MISPNKWLWKVDDDIPPTWATTPLKRVKFSEEPSHNDLTLELQNLRIEDSLKPTVSVE